MGDRSELAVWGDPGELPEQCAALVESASAFVRVLGVVGGVTLLNGSSEWFEALSVLMDLGGSPNGLVEVPGVDDGLETPWPFDARRLLDDVLSGRTQAWVADWVWSRRRLVYDPSAVDCRALQDAGLDELRLRGVDVPAEVIERFHINWRLHLFGSGPGPVLWRLECPKETMVAIDKLDKIAAIARDPGKEIVLAIERSDAPTDGAILRMLEDKAVLLREAAIAEKQIDAMVLELLRRGVKVARIAEVLQRSHQAVSKRWPRSMYR